MKITETDCLGTEERECLVCYLVAAAQPDFVRQTKRKNERMQEILVVAIPAVGRQWSYVCVSC